MSRKTLAAGMASNTPEILHDWVANPQKLKPGCLMPAFSLSEDNRALMVSYLSTLR
jgi:cytochrome c oxidase subunit 2